MIFVVCGFWVCLGFAVLGWGGLCFVVVVDLLLRAYVLSLGGFWVLWVWDCCGLVCGLGWLFSGFGFGWVLGLCLCLGVCLVVLWA